MNTEAQVLTLAQWFSPAYPTGAFAYSHGLETAIQNATIQTAAQLQDWLADVLSYGTGRNDAILLRAAYACDTLQELHVVDSAARAFAGSAERVQESSLQGAAFSKTTAAIWGEEAHDFTSPVAAGYAAKRMNIPVQLTVAMYLQAFTSNLVSAAIRLVPLGQTEGQAVLAALTPLCQTITTQTQGAALDALQGSAFLSDIAAMQHETLQPRIFRT